MSTFGNSTSNLSRSNSGERSNWSGYEWNVPLDEIVDCTKCPTCCQRCYSSGKRRPKWQKGMLVFFYLALFDIALALLFRFSIYSETEFYLGDKDQRLINRGDDSFNLSPGLCSAYQLQVVGGAALFKAYVFPETPHENRNPSEYHQTNPSLSLPADDVFIMYHYLGDSASVTLWACAPERAIYLYTVRSTSSIGYWESHKCCGRYSDSFVFRKCNQDGSSLDSRRYSSDSGYYGDLFFVLMNDPYRELPDSLENLNVTSVLNRYDYHWNEEQPTDSCNATGKCSLNLEEAESVMVELSEDTDTYAKLQGTCVASLWKYCLYFAIIPLGVTLSVTLIGVVLCGLQMQVNRLAEEGDRQRSATNRDPRGSSQTRTRSSRAPTSSPRSPLVRNEIYQTDEESRDLPPSYDSVAVVNTVSDLVGTEEPPPSYSSLVAEHDVV